METRGPKATLREVDLSSTAEVGKLRHLHLFVTSGHIGHSKSHSVLFIYLFLFLGLRLWHMEVPRLGVELELRLLA